MKSGKCLLLFITLLYLQNTRAQFLMDMIDSTTDMGKGMIDIYKKFDHIRLGGYIQPQFQLASGKGIKSFEGGDFSPRVSNRFILRRSRIRIDYIHFEKNNQPGIQIVFQFDANERGFTVRDVWGRIFESKFRLFSFTTGMFARPFGYEINLSSSDRESPERGRMSQTLMKSERDLGAMISYNGKKGTHLFNYLKVDAGLFNGQGINAAGDFDNSKDFIGRIALKPFKVYNALSMSVGTSVLYGGLENNTKYHYTTENQAGIKKVTVDSAITNVGRLSPRRYYGADIQWKLKTKAGYTELRGEFLTGLQTGSANNSETPASLLTGFEGFHTRHFNGAYFYLLHNIFSAKHQLLLKYDWYDPNTKVAGKEIGVVNANLSAANIKYKTIALGYLYYITVNVKGVVYYSITSNEKTLLPGFESNLNARVLTMRIQFRF